MSFEGKLRIEHVEGLKQGFPWIVLRLAHGSAAAFLRRFGGRRVLSDIYQMVYTTRQVKSHLILTSGLLLSPMTVETVRAFLAAHAPDIAIVETDASTATVELAARGHGVQPAQIAKTLSLRIRDRALLIVAAGTARLNNRKIKDALGGKPRMLTAEEVVALKGDGEVVAVAARRFENLLPIVTSTDNVIQIHQVRILDEIVQRATKLALRLSTLDPAFSDLRTHALSHPSVAEQAMQTTLNELA